MDPFSSSAFQHRSHFQDSPLLASSSHDTIFNSHYRFHPDFQDSSDTQPFVSILENPSLDPYEPNHFTNSHTFFNHMPQEPTFYQNRYYVHPSSRTPTFLGTVNDFCDEMSLRREENLETTDIADIVHYKGSKCVPAQANNTAVKGFMDLVTKASSFWIDKLAPADSWKPVAAIKQEEQRDSQKGLFGKKDLKLTISYPCLISTNAINNHKAAFEPQDDTETTVQKSTSNISLDKLDKGLETVSQKNIRKTVKTTKGKWRAAHDQKLLNLVQELGTSSWSEIATAFKEDFITAKCVQERYKLVSKRDSKPRRQAFTREEDLEIARHYKLCGGNWESISKFFPNRRSAVLRNRFYSSIRENLDDFLREFESNNSTELTEDSNLNQESVTAETPEQDSSGFTEEKHIDNTCEKVCVELEGNIQQSQDDILDSYFNKEPTDESDGLVVSEKGFDNEALSINQEETLAVAFTRKVEEDAIGGKVWEDKPAKEAIEILNGRISLLKSLYNQTRFELDKLQSEEKELCMTSSVKVIISSRLLNNP